jgi:hypothetical protein
VSEVRSTRRRRSVAVAPALLDPAELPEDAPGRVKLITVEAPADILDAPGSAKPPAARSLSLLAAREGWIAVAVAGVLIVALFIVGMLLTRS